MTTIVYHNGVIAYDSRCTNGTLITDNNFNKCIKNKGVMFFMSGANCDEQNLIDAYHGLDYKKENVDATAIINDNGVIYLSSICGKDGFWKEEVTKKPCCIGSGSSHAWTAIDCGRDAVGAVKMAIKRDMNSGGRVRTHKV